MSIRRQSMLIFLTSIIQLAFGMGAGILTARLLGAEGKGIALLAFYLPSFLASLGSLSIGEASTYFIGRGVDARRVVSNTLIAAFGLGLVYVLACLGFLGPIAREVVPDVPIPFVLAGLSVLPLMLLKNYGDGLLIALDRLPWFIAGNLALHVARAAFLLIALVPMKAGVAGAVAAEFASWILTGTIYLYAILSRTGFTWRIDRSLAGEQLRYSSMAHVGNMAMRANHQVSTLILSSMAGAQAVGLFSVATSMAQVLWYLPDSVGRILFPRVASSSREEANRLTPMVCRHTMMITAAACLALWATGPWVIGLLYGDEFQASVVPMNLLLPGILFSVLNRVLSKYLSGIGQPKLNSIASVLGLLVNVPLLLFLIGVLGVTGASIATSVAYMVNGLVMLVFFVRVSGSGYRACLVPTIEDLRIYPAAVAQLWKR